MQKKFAAFAAIAAVALLAACGGGGSGGGYNPPSSGGGGGSTPPPPPTVPANTIAIAFPAGIGTEKDPTWGAVGGFTQQGLSQVLGFAPGTSIMLQNLSTTTPHTLNVVSAGAVAPAVFPANPALSTGAGGGSNIQAGFSSGAIPPGGKVGPFTLMSGTYLIGCAFHYSSNNMQDVLVVAAAATPGPQAQQTPSPGGGGPPGGGY
ncbi:MAG: hypothetical protein M3Y21_02090 [Candidatus Eremiobacteraeota bacterium]|nr:hypothetical protein [Candidatus Eremiobacteraeota bacterium]